MKLLPLLIAIVLMAGCVQAEEVEPTIYFTEETEPTPFIYCEVSSSRDIVFDVDGLDFIRLCPNGDFYIKGERYTRDQALYLKFKEWLKMCGVIELQDNERPITIDKHREETGIEETPNEKGR